MQGFNDKEVELVKVAVYKNARDLDQVKMAV